MCRMNFFKEVVKTREKKEKESAASSSSKIVRVHMTQEKLTGSCKYNKHSLYGLDVLCSFMRES